MLPQDLVLLERLRRTILSQRYSEAQLLQLRFLRARDLRIRLLSVRQLHLGPSASREVRRVGRRLYLLQLALVSQLPGLQLNDVRLPLLRLQLPLLRLQPPLLHLQPLLLLLLPPLLRRWMQVQLPRETWPASAVPS